MASLPRKLAKAVTCTTPNVDSGYDSYESYYKFSVPQSEVLNVYEPPVDATTQPETEVGMPPPSHITSYEASLLEKEEVEYQYRDYTWKLMKEFQPYRNGGKLRKWYAVQQSGKELYTYNEGTSSYNAIKYTHLCGEIVSSKRLTHAGKLKHVFARINTETSKSGLNVNSSVPLFVDCKNKVLVFRTHGESLFLQLLPSVHSEYELIPGTPLFDKNNSGVAAVIGNMFSDFEYVVNCTSCEVMEIPLYKNRYGTDRLRILCIDRRGNNEASEPKAVSNYYSYSSQNQRRPTAHRPMSSTAMSLVDAVLTEPSGGAGAIVDVGSGGVRQINDTLYVGVVNDQCQVTDTFTHSEKKNKPPKAIVTICIDDNGINVTYMDDQERLVAKWLHDDPSVQYFIMPRRYFDANDNVIYANVKTKGMKRYQSLERLI